MSERVGDAIRHSGLGVCLALSNVKVVAVTMPSADGVDPYRATRKPSRAIV